MGRFATVADLILAATFSELQEHASNGEYWEVKLDIGFRVVEILEVKVNSSSSYNTKQIGQGNRLVSQVWEDRWFFLVKYIGHADGFWISGDTVGRKLLGW